MIRVTLARRLKRLEASLTHRLSSRGSRSYSSPRRPGEMIDLRARTPFPLANKLPRREFRNRGR